MRVRVVSFADGGRWLLQGWRLFRVAPLAWLALVIAYWVIMSVASLVPFVGLAAATVLIPAFSVGFMAISRSCERRSDLDLRLLFEGFRLRPAVQFRLGAVYLALLATLLWATSLVDDGTLARWMLWGRRPEDEAFQSDAFFLALALAALLYLPVMMLYWFAPVLGAWHAVGAAKALFFSFVASLMNWRAFLGYGLAATVVTVVIPLIALNVLLILSGGRLRVGVMTLVFPLLVVLLPTLFASFYASYRDVFGIQGES